MDLQTQRLMTAAAGAAGGDPIGVEDVFKTYVYRGNATARSINTGVDLSGSEDGIVWIKKLTGSTGTNVSDHMLFSKTFYSSADNLYFYNSPNLASSINYGSNGFSAFNNNGFSIGTGSRENANNEDYVSWTFKKKEKFLDIVTWTKTGSNGTSARTLNHNLGSTPGFIMLKQYNGSENWICWHRSLGSNEYWKLNSNHAVSISADASVNSVSSTQFVVGKDNDRVGSYIAFIFAHEEAEFGPNSDQKIISCGTYNGTGNAGDNKISLPFEPGWLLLKQIESDTDPNMGRPQIQDNMRGWAVHGTSSVTAERDKAIDVDQHNNQWSWPQSDPLSDGFLLQTGGSSGTNVSGKSYMYVAIAAETGKTMKAIETGSDVFAMDTGSGSSTIPNYDSGFPVDFAFHKNPTSSTGNWHSASRLTQGKYLDINSTQAEAAWAAMTFDSNTGFSEDSYTSSQQAWMWKRHAGFDVVAYDGTGSARTQAHNLGVKPEFYIVKKRDSTKSWYCYHEGLNGGTTPENYTIVLNSAGTDDPSAWTWNNTAPTASAFSLASDDACNGSGNPYLALLFATTAVSKVGFYNGSGGAGNARTCEFSPRFILITSVSTSTNWLVFDTTRGINNSGDEKVLYLNDDESQSNIGDHDYVSVSSSGFSFTDGNTNVNASGEEYIYYAHA